jgi:hypothetical protein
MGNLTHEPVAGDIELDDQHDLLLGLSAAPMRRIPQPMIMQISI